MASKQYLGGKEGMDHHDNSLICRHHHFPLPNHFGGKLHLKKKWLSPVKKVDLSKNRIDFD